MKRIKEPSTWAGIGVFLSALVPMLGLSGAVATAVGAAITAVCGAVAVGLREKGTE